RVDFAAGAYASDAVAGDFNSDGAVDLAVVGSLGTVNLLLGHGDGTFGAPSQWSVGAGSHSISLGDFNQDGALDVVTMNANTTSVLFGNGDGTFPRSNQMILPGNTTNTVVDDFDRDGHLDIATTNTVSTGTVTILKGHGDGSFSAPASYYAYTAP